MSTSRATTGSTTLRSRVIAGLMENARQMSTANEAVVRTWPGLVLARGDGRSSFLPGYAPYVGRDYFSDAVLGRRILAYAMSQNLRGNEEFALKWAEDWRIGDGIEALDRQNRSCKGGSGEIMMSPFDSGHIPILCAIVRRLLIGGAGVQHSSIYPEVAATNLSKFSFRSADGKITRDCSESLAKCWEWFSAKEVQLLQPDVILCVGDPVDRVVRSAITKAPQTEARHPVVLRTPFPGLRVINRWYRRPDRLGLPKGRDWVHELRIIMCDSDLAANVEHGRGRLERIIERDVWYFAAMWESLREQFVRISPSG